MHASAPSRRLALTVVAVAVVVAGDRPLVDTAVVVGIGFVAPLALDRSGWWSVAALAAAVGLRTDEGVLACLFVVPAVAVSTRSVLAAARHLPARRPTLTEAAGVLAPAWALVAMFSLLASTAGEELFGIGEPIVRLTAVHYLYAGVGALVIARRLHDEVGRYPRLATSAVVTTALAPPVVAAGFVLNQAVPQIGGAVVMSIGVWSSAAVLLLRTPRNGFERHRLLRLAAGLTPWVPMTLAVSWAAAQHVQDVPALSVPDMARFHGLANGVGFVLLGLLATSPDRPTTMTPIASEVRS